MTRNNDLLDQPLLAKNSIEKETQAVKANATLFSTFLNLTNNIVGAGILSLPHTFKSASIIGGTFLMLISGILSTLSMILIAMCCEVTGHFTYKALGDRIIGPKFGIALQFIMFVYTSLSGLAYLILIGDFLVGDSGIIHSICSSDTCTSTLLFKLLSKRVVMVPLVTVTVLAPLSFMKSLHSLRYTSLISALSTLLLLAFLINNYLTTEPATDVKVFQIDSGWFEACPIINVAFICHYNTPKYYQEMKNRSMFNFILAVCLAFGFCCLVYLLVAFCGYMSFGEEVNGDILTNFPANDTWAIIVRFALALVVTFTYPLAFNALRLAALSLLEKIDFQFSSNEKKFNIVTTFLIIFTLVPSCFVTNIAVVLDYKGATFGGFIGFGFAGILFFYVMNLQANSMYFYYPKVWTVVSIAFLIWTFATGILGVVITTRNLIENKD